MSPTVFRDGQFRFCFNSREEDRLHVHVESPEGQLKVWLEPRIELAQNHGGRVGGVSRQPSGDRTSAAETWTHLMPALLFFVCLTAAAALQLFAPREIAPYSFRAAMIGGVTVLAAAAGLGVAIRSTSRCSG